MALAHTDADGNWSDTVLNPDQAIAHLLLNAVTPNLYFRASAFDGKGYAEANCVSARALFLDIDYGKAGHSKTSIFKTLNDAAGYVLTMPVRPSVCWRNDPKAADAHRCCSSPSPPTRGVVYCTAIRNNAVRWKP